MKANWIKSPVEMDFACPVFRKQINLEKEIKEATITISARGIYEATLNGKRIGDFIFAPGCTAYDYQIQAQTYDITENFCENNTIDIVLSQGWYKGKIIFRGRDKETPEVLKQYQDREPAIYAELKITYKDGIQDIVITDETWLVAKSRVQFADIYDGEVYDATYTPDFSMNAVVADDNDTSVLIETIGEKVIEQERLKPIGSFVTPKGEMVIDFGQNITGYPEITVNAKAGQRVVVSFSETMDKDGNFYNENYRGAKCFYDYTCKDGLQTYKPSHTFYGFRYIRIDEFPEEINLNNFTAIVVHSKMKRTGYVNTSDIMINKLFSNIVWGQKGNFLDIPTDCPQRDERHGWSADAAIFIKAASYNYDVRKFMRKWLSDMKLEQTEKGEVYVLVPRMSEQHSVAAWSDAITIIPWQLYLTYGEVSFLESMFPAMKKWVDCITNRTEKQYMWVGGWQYSDWLELNAGFGKFKGNTREELVATAYYAHSTELVCKIGKILGEDVSKYEQLYKNIVATYKKEFGDNLATQTEHILSLKFHLVDNEEAVAKSLAQLIIDNGKQFDTGFLGSAFILEILGQYGYGELAYELLLREQYPSWLYSVKMGATTVWEHWDGIKPDGEMWSMWMNSFNHYAYGAVAGWMYEYCAGINTVESAPGFKEILFQPHPTEKIQSFDASIETVQGTASSRWWHNNEGKVRYEITTPSNATAIINGKEYILTPGTYMF